MTDIVKNIARLITSEFHSRQKDPGKDRMPVATAISDDMKSQLYDWAKKYDASCVADGKKIVHREGSPFVIYVKVLDGPGPLLSRFAASTCVMSVMYISDTGIGYPQSAVVYAPVTKQIWTAEKERGVTFKSTYTNGTGLLSTFESRDTTNKEHTIDVTHSDTSDTKLRSICGKLGYNKKFVVANTGSTALGASLLTLSNSMIDGCISIDRSAGVIAPLSLLIRELGGIVTDLSGKTIDGFEYIGDTADETNNTFDFILKNGAVLTTNQAVHDALLKAITPRKRTAKTCPS